MAKPQGTKVIADNRKARHDYTLLERVEAGVQLLGTEVKSLRENGATLAQAHAEERGGELWLVGAHIAPYDKSGASSGHEPERDRKLLLHRREIDRLAGRVRERGLTLVPTRLYFKDGRAKVEIALARGKELATSAGTSRNETPTARSSARSGRATADVFCPVDKSSQNWHNSVPGRAGTGLIRPATARLRCEDIRGRPGFDVVGSPAELRVEVPVGLVKQPGTT